MNNTFLNDIKNQYKNGTALIKLIFVNVAVFLFVNVIGLSFWLFNIADGTDMLVNWLELPADFTKLIFKPWTLFSYMFLHQGLFHILMNMLILYFGSQIFLQFLSEKKLVSYYFLGGLFGALLYLLTYNVFPVFDGVASNSTLLGASASVIAILVAVATYVPNYVVRFMFIGDVKLKYIAIGYVVLDLVSIQNNNPGGHIAHLGGALFGFLAIQQLKKGNDITSGFSQILAYIKAMFKPHNKMKVVYKKQGKTKSNKAYNEQKVNNQKKVDAILDKISKSGYESLSAEEKAILFDASDK